MSVRGLAILVGIFCCPSTASADPFTRGNGEGRIIVNWIHTNSERVYNNDGHSAPINEYRQDHIYINGEYGISDDLTVIVAPSFQSIEQTNGPERTGPGFAEVGAKYRVAHGQDWTFSVQAAARIPGEKNTDSVAQISQSGMEYDLKAGAGLSFGPKRKMFATAELGYRFRNGDPPNEYHADFAIGGHVADRLMLIGASYNTFSDGRGAGVFRQKHRYNDVYVSAVYKVNDRISVQAGYTATISGRNALKQSGPLLGLWSQF